MSEFTAEALEFLAKQAQQAEALTPIATGDARQLTFVNGSGTIVNVPAPPSIRNHRVLSVDDMVSAAENWGKGGPDADDDGVIFHNAERVVLVVNDWDRHDNVTLELAKSDIWLTVEKFRVPVSMDQRKLVRLLKVDLFGCHDARLLEAAKKIEAVSSDKVSSDVTTGRERGIREFVDEIANAQDVPETVVLTVPVYVTPGITDTVTVELSVDYTLRPEIRFTLQALPDSLNAAIHNIQGILGSRLEKNKAKLPVFYGSP